MSTDAAGKRPVVPAPVTTVQVIKVTEPVCLACWTMEPVWRRLLRHYGQRIQARHVFGSAPRSWSAAEAAVGVRLVDPALEAAYLRRIREAVFMQGREVTRPGVLLELAAAVGVDTAALAAVLEDGRAEVAFAADRAEARRLGACRLPTLVVSAGAQSVTLVGAVPYDRLQRAVELVAAAGSAGSVDLRAPVRLT